MLLNKVLRPSVQGYGSIYNPNGVEDLKHTIGSPWVDEGAYEKRYGIAATPSSL